MNQSHLETQIENFFSKFQLHKYKKGELILQPYTNPRGAYFLKKGFVRVFGISPSGSELTIHIFQPGSYFPMMCVLSEIKNRYYFEALTNTECYNAPKDEVIDFLKQNSDILMDLTKRIFQGIDKLTYRMEYLSFGKAYDRVVSILIYLARHFGETQGKTISLSTKFTHRDIASLAGISRETASREWEILERKKLINYKKQLIIIQDIGKLEKELAAIEC